MGHTDTQCCEELLTSLSYIEASGLMHAHGIASP